MEATASAKYLRGSPQKARLVVDMIRGKDVNQALAILRSSRMMAQPAFIPVLKRPVKHSPGVSRH